MMLSDSDMLTRWEMGSAKTSDPILRMVTGIPWVPSAEVDLSPVKIFAILPAFAKSSEKVEEIFPLVSPLLEVVALSRVLFSTPLVLARVFPTFSTS
jgi:hypothetical protein